MNEIKLTHNELNKIALSSDAIKCIAVFAMLIDHAAFGILHAYLANNAMSILPQTYTKLNNIYDAGRTIGRLAMPIFAFFLVEGYIRTSNIGKYILRMFVFSILSEIPFDLAFFNTAFYPEHQNIMFTFLIALIMLAAFDYLNKTILGLSVPVKVLALLFCVVAFADVAAIAKCDYGYKCIALIAILYILREHKGLRLVSGAAAVCWEKCAPAAFLFLYFYDDSRKPRLKYFFYIFYPLHLIIIFIIKRMVLG